MRKVIVVLSFIVPVALVAWYKPSVPANEGVQWMTLQEAEVSYNKHQKPILIDLYTDWCGWCKVMDKETYSKKEVAEYIMQKFYPVKLNAEQKQAIAFRGNTYQFNNKNRAHDFAIYLTNGRLMYPTTVIIPMGGNQPEPIPGYLKPKDLEPIVKYFGEGHYGKIAYKDFEKNLQKSW